MLATNSAVAQKFSDDTPPTRGLPTMVQTIRTPSLFQRRTNPIRIHFSGSPEIAEKTKVTKCPKTEVPMRQAKLNVMARCWLRWLFRVTVKRTSAKSELCARCWTDRKRTREA